MPQNTDSDSILPYIVEPWEGLGYAIPNYGDDEKTANSDIQKLVTNIGRRTQQVASLPCTLITTPPKIDTLLMMCGLLDALRTEMGHYTLRDDQSNVKTPHVTPKSRDFLIFPAPYFKITNPWMDSWIHYSLEGLSMMMQSNENIYPRKWGLEFAKSVQKLYREIEEQIGSLLLKLPTETVQADEWKLTKELIKAEYKPSTWHESTAGEMPTPVELLAPTEDTRKTLTRGIPAWQIPAVPIAKPPTTNSSGSSGGSFARA